MKDQLSALMDGEFEIESAEHIITSVKSGGELKEAWQHYHLIGDAIRGELGHGNCAMRHDFCAHVMHALDAEPTVLSPTISQTNSHAVPEAMPIRKSMFKSTKVWSIAASVAAVMFVSLMLVQQQITPSEDMTPVEIAQNLPVEYLAAHQAAAPSSAAYYIQTASFSPSSLSSEEAQK